MDATIKIIYNSKEKEEVVLEFLAEKDVNEYVANYLLFLENIGCSLAEIKTALKLNKDSVITRLKCR